MGWTRQSAAASLLRAMEDYRRAAGQRVISLRESRGLSQEDLANAAGVSVKTVSRFENGRNEGRRGTVRALAKALAVSEADILGGPPPLLPVNAAQIDDDDAPEWAQRIEAMLDAILSRLDDLKPDAEPALAVPPGPSPSPRARQPKRASQAQ
jgi:transcriptional regulator with XRE-family HTH domain